MNNLLRVLTLKWICCLTFSLTLTSMNYAELDPKTVIGLWLLDEGQGEKTKDTSGNDQHGTLRNGAKWTAGKFGQALDLDGQNDYVEIADSPQLGDMKKITVAGWVFPRTSAGYTGYIDKTRGGTAGWRSYNLAQRNGQWEWGLANEANAKVTLQAGATKLKKWVHLAGTYDGKGMILYKDGEKIGTIAQTGPVQDSDSILALGCWPGGGISNFASILIDEVVIFNEALGAKEIKSFMESGLERALAVSPQGRLATTWGILKKTELSIGR